MCPAGPALRCSHLEHDARARGVGAGRPSAAVNVELRLTGQLVVNDVLHTLNVKAARRHIRRHHDGGFARLEPVKALEALPARHGDRTRVGTGGVKQAAGPRCRLKSLPLLHLGVEPQRLCAQQRQN